MALASKESAMAIIQASAFYDDQDFGGPSLLQLQTSNSNSSQEDHHLYCPNPVNRAEPQSPEIIKNSSSTVSSPSSTNSNGANSLITFNPDFATFITSSSLLSFDQTNKPAVHKHQYPAMWQADHHHMHYPNSAEASSATAVEWGWLNDHEITNGGQDTGGRQESANNKRPSTGENLQAVKKQCVAASKKAKPKSAAESKDPQSVAAKNRRERISERLKTLQELVPNGSKVDLVTMLEKAISYVKFLQLQVKVLAADEFWPAQGGKAPDLSQVREAIDAILANSQRDRSSTAK